MWEKTKKNKVQYLSSSKPKTFSAIHRPTQVLHYNRSFAVYLVQTVNGQFTHISVTLWNFLLVHKYKLVVHKYMIWRKWLINNIITQNNHPPRSYYFPLIQKSIIWIIFLIYLVRKEFRYQGNVVVGTRVYTRDIVTSAKSPRVGRDFRNPSVWYETRGGLVQC